jgi:hypothetical protein
MSFGFGFGFPRCVAASGGLPPWTPAQLTTALWLDAEDTSTITLNGSTVSQWADKSGNARHILQAVASQQPTWNATGLNSKPTLVFDGSSDILLNQNAGSVGVTNITLVAVMRYVSASTEDMLMGVGQTNNVRAVRAFYRANAATTQGFSTWGSDVPSSSLSADIGGSPHIFEAVMANTTSVKLYRDGVIDTGAPRALESGAALPVSFDGFSIGSLQGSLVGGYYSNIEVSEALVLYTAISTDNRQKLEGYLAWKWGLQADLPVGHPYKNTPPTV